MRFSRFLKSFALATLSWIVFVPTASAHFLFARIGNHAEGGRAVEVFFSERAVAGDPKYIDRFDDTRLWIQSEPGKFRELEVVTAGDRVRSLLPSQQAVGVIGAWTYGVLSRDVDFLLEHFPKALSGDPAELNKLTPHEATPLEIMARFAEGRVELTALADGKPVPLAEFTTVDDDLLNDELVADKSGKVGWTPPGRGHYSVYVSRKVEREGTYEGEAYDEVRQFATLSFHWPPARSDGDAEAVSLFQDAIQARAQWREFPGFRAAISGSVAGRVFDGTVQVDKTGSVELDIDEPTVEGWVEDRLGSIVLHRMPQEESAEPPVLQFADNDTGHPMGRLLTFVGGSFASSYRVRDNQILVVNRNIGRQNFTITVLDNLKNAEGRYLPQSYVVRYWDAQSGQLLKSETVQQRWRRVAGLDLPAQVTVSTASAAGLQVRGIRLSDHQPLR